MKKQGFIEGAIILIIANAISKILGAVFKIPLTYILHEDGMGIFNSAFTVYIMGLSLVTSGFPIAVSKEISTALSKNDTKKTAQITCAAEVILLLLGLLGSTILFFGAHFFAYAIKEPLAKDAIRIASPAICAVALGTVYKSYFQGTKNMNPTAISQVVESVFRLILGICLASYFSYSVNHAAAGAIGGVMIGEFIATAILFLLYRKNRLYKLNVKPQKNIYTSLLRISVPLMLASVVGNLISVVELSVIRHSLEGLTFTGDAANHLVCQFGERFNSNSSAITLTSAGANWLYGAYSGYAVTLFHLPIGIISTFCVSLFPYIAGSYASGNILRTKRTIKKGIATITTLAIPAAILLYFLSDELLIILFKNSASSYMLKILAFSVVPVCIIGMCSNALYASGSVMSPFISSFIGSVVKIILCATLVSKPYFHIYGVPIAAFFDFFTVMIINLSLIYKKYGGLKLTTVFLKILAGAFMMIATSHFILSRIEDFGTLSTIIIFTIISVSVYLITVLIFGLKHEF